jgi:hypothetical protein
MAPLCPRLLRRVAFSYIQWLSLDGSSIANCEAAAWVAYLNTPAAQAVYREFGFGPAEGDNK